MAGSGRKYVGIGIGTLAIAVVMAIGWKAIFPSSEPDAGPQLQTLCGYVRSAARAQCTMAVAPEAFPVGNVVVLPDPPNPDAPLPITYRDFASVCWLKPEEQDDIRKRLARPAADLNLSGFSVEVTRKLKAGASVTLAEADNLRIGAGSNSDRIKSVSVTPRAAKVLVIDQGQLEALLHRPEVREDCFTRLLGSRTRLVVSVLYSSGLDYSVVASNDDRLDLDAAVKSGYIKVDMGPQGSSSSKVTTTLSSTEPRVIGVVFADDLMFDDLRKLVAAGNSIAATGRNRVTAAIRLQGDPAASETTIRQTPDGSLLGIRSDPVTSALVPAIQRTVTDAPVPGGGTPSVRLSRGPELAGTATSTSSNSVPGAETPSASVVWDTNLNVVNLGADAELTWNGNLPFAPRTTRFVTLPVAVRLEQQVFGEFQVFKRRDGEEALLVTISQEGPGLNPVGAAGTVRIRVLDSSSNQVGPETSLDPNDVRAEARTATLPLTNAGVYRVVALQSPTLSNMPRQLSIKSHLTATVSLGAVAKVSPSPQPDRQVPIAPAPSRP